MSGWYWREPLWLLAASYPLFLWAWSHRRRQRIRLGYADAELWPWVRAEAPRARGGGIRRIILALAWVLLTVAAAGPRLPLEVQAEARPPAGALLAVLDLSRSMDARDAGGSRRAAGLGLLRAWNDAPGRPPLGLLVFAGQAHLFFPPSADRQAVAHFLDQLPGLVLPTLGNDLAGALDLAGGLLGDIAGPRALVVLSDGDLDDSARAQAEAAVRRLRERLAVDLSVVGLGGTTATAVPDPAQGWLRVEGRPVVSRLEASWLEDLAQVGDGHYLTASVEGGVALGGVWRAPAPRILDADGVLWRELYPWALAPAVLLLGLGLTGRLPHLALAMVVAGLGGTMAPVPGQAAEGAAAFAALARGDAEVARGLYRALPGYAGRFGEGAACFRLGEWSCAAEAFATAAWLAEDDTQRGRAAYNLAATRYRQGDYTAAARLYRDAQAHGLDQPGLQPMIDLSDVLAGQVEALREQQAGALQRARAGTRVQEAGRDNDLAAERELDLAPPPPPPLPQAMARGVFDELVARGLDQARLAGPDAAQANAGRAWFGGEDVAAERSGTQLWQRLFEIEEGFPAPVAQPQPRPDQRPW